jgi:hypothetical protein
LAKNYSGGCQCGKVRFEVGLEITEVIACNCSRCGRLGSLLAFAPLDDFRLLAGEPELTTYNFNRGYIHHKFCSSCGIQSFAIGTNPKTGAQMAAINVRCLDDVDPSAFKVRHVDGKHM